MSLHTVEYFEIDGCDDCGCAYCDKYSYTYIDSEEAIDVLKEDGWTWSPSEDTENFWYTYCPECSEKIKAREEAAKR